MKRHMMRTILLLILVISLCVITTIPVNAAAGQKQKAHGAGKTYADLSQFPGWSGSDESHINFTFESPDKGYYEYRTFAGPWTGSWARIEVKGLDFGSYDGSIQEITPGSPVVYYWGQCTAGESYTDLDYPGIPPGMVLIPYSNIEGWYKVGAFIDGGPGHDNDCGLFTVEIPPEGNPMLPFIFPDIIPPGLDGETQAQLLFDAVVNGEIEFGFGNLVTGNVNIR